MKKMKKFLTVLCLVLSSFTYAQSEPEVAVREFKPIDEKIYIEAFNSFNLDTLCDATVLVTFLGDKEKSYYVKRADISKKIKSWIHKPGLKYTFSGWENSGYVISISQVNSEELYTKFITVFTSYQTGKICVIEIKDND